MAINILKQAEKIYILEKIQLEIFTKTFILSELKYKIY